MSFNTSKHNVCFFFDSAEQFKCKMSQGYSDNDFPVNLKFKRGLGLFTKKKWFDSSAIYIVLMNKWIKVLLRFSFFFCQRMFGVEARFHFLPNFVLEQNLLFVGQSVDENKLPKNKSIFCTILVIKITNYVVHFFSPHLIAGEKKPDAKYIQWHWNLNCTQPFLKPYN